MKSTKLSVEVDSDIYAWIIVGSLTKWGFNPRLSGVNGSKQIVAWHDTNYFTIGFCRGGGLQVDYRSGKTLMLGCEEAARIIGASSRDQIVGLLQIEKGETQFHYAD